MSHRALWAAALCVALAIPSAEARQRSLLDGFTKAFQMKRHPTKVSPARYKHQPKPKHPSVGNADLDRYDAAPTVGRASWYGEPFHGRKTASGVVYDMEAPMCAHRKLRFGSLVHITNLSNGKTATCRIRDRGPFVAGRIIDVSHLVAAQLGMIQSGVARVSIGVIE